MKPLQGLLRHAFELSPDFRVVGFTSDANEAVLLSRENRVDVILLDVMMPRLSGLAALEHLTDALPDTKIISFSTNKSQEGIAVGANAVIDNTHRPMMQLPLVLSRLLHVSVFEQLDI